MKNGLFSFAETPLTPCLHLNNYQSFLSNISNGAKETIRLEQSAKIHYFRFARARHEIVKHLS